MAHKAPNNRVCGICGKGFYVKPSHAEIRQWCSLVCRAAGLRRRRQVEIEARFNEPIRDLLNRLYHTEQRPIREIANMIGVSSRNLFEWFYALEISRRDRATAVAMQWEGNEERRANAAEWMRKNIVSTDPEERQAKSAKANAALQERRGPTSIERRMTDALDAEGIAYEAQHTIGGKFVCDIVFPAAMLVVECDGQYWHNTPRQKRTDKSKDAYLQKCGYTVMRFSDVQIKKDVHVCVRAIKAFLNLP